MKSSKMTQFLINSNQRLRTWWLHYNKSTLRIAIIIMTIAATVWLVYEFYRLVWRPDYIGFYKVHPGAIDLKIRFREVHGWFASKPAYTIMRTDYPPASYPMLWPFLGWLELKPAILLWAITSLAALGWLVCLVVRESKAETFQERIFVALMPLSMYAAGATIGNGQLIVHILPMLTAGSFMICRKQYNLLTDLAGSFLILASLVKPNVSVPFFWIILFVPGRLRPAIFIIMGYTALTLFAASFQESEPVSLFFAWINQGYLVTTGYGTAHIDVLLAAMGMGEYNFVASIIILAALGFWIFYHRCCDIRLLLGVTAITARFWAFHFWYDDFLILLPMIALFRIAKKDSLHNKNGLVAGLLLGITILTGLAPGGLYLLPLPWNMIYVNFQVVVWLIVLIFLLNQVRQEKAKGYVKP